MHTMNEQKMYKNTANCLCIKISTILDAILTYFW